MKKIFLTILTYLIIITSHAQDSTKRRSHLWGDTWHFMPATSISESDRRFFVQPEIGFGRSKWRVAGGESRHGDVDVYTSIGVGYSCFFNDRMNNLAHIYFDRANKIPYPLPFIFTYRVDYMYNFNGNTHYLRPGAGLTLWRLDVLYVKNIRIGHDEYIGTGGISLRFRVFSQNRFMDSY